MEGSANFGCDAASVITSKGADPMSKSYEELAVEVVIAAMQHGALQLDGKTPKAKAESASECLDIVIKGLVKTAKALE
jgi:hypothetical protein